MKMRTIRGEEYTATVLKVLVRYPDGRPKECVMVHDDQSTDVADVHKQVLSKDNPRRNAMTMTNPIETPAIRIAHGSHSQSRRRLE